MEGVTMLEQYFLLFIIYSFGGWIIEEINCSIKEKKIVDRGFLIGPICPIYGFGGIIMTIYLTQFNNNPILLFLTAVLACAILEYLTSYIMEKVFNARWWDYSKEKINLNGRICLRTLIPFGIFGLIIVYIFNPILFNWIDKLSYKTLAIISWSGIALILIDFFISMNVVSKVTSTAKKMSKENPKDDTDEITKKVKTELRKSITGKRLINAFPDFKAFKIKIKEVAEKGKEALEQQKNKVKTITSNKKQESEKEIKK